MYGTKFGDIRPLVCKKDEGFLFYPSRGFDITVSRSLTRYPRGMDDGKLNRVKKKRGKKTEPSLKFSSRLIIEIQLWHSFLLSFFFQSTLGLSDFFLSLIYNAFRTEREREIEREEKIRNWNCLSLKNTHGSCYSTLTGGQSPANQIKSQSSVARLTRDETNFPMEKRRKTIIGDAHWIK